MIGFLAQGRVRIKIRIRVGVMVNVIIYPYEQSSPKQMSDIQF